MNTELTTDEALSVLHAYCGHTHTLEAQAAKHLLDKYQALLVLRAEQTAQRARAQRWAGRWKRKARSEWKRRRTFMELTQQFKTERDAARVENKALRRQLADLGVPPLDVYQKRLPIMRTIAREHGYALAVHGTGLRDMDIVAVPWVESVSTPDVLAEAIRAAIDGVILNDGESNDFTRRNPQPKPHGRLAYTIQIGAGHYIDLGIVRAALLAGGGENPKEGA